MVFFCACHSRKYSLAYVMYARRRKERPTMMTRAYHHSSHHSLVPRPFLCCFVHRLLKMDGALLVYAGDSHKEAQVTGAIASNLWGAYHSHTESVILKLLPQLSSLSLCLDHSNYLFPVQLRFFLCNADCVQTDPCPARQTLLTLHLKYAVFAKITNRRILVGWNRL